MAFLPFSFTFAQSFHPADVSSDWILDGTETTGYGACWKNTTCTWNGVPSYQIDGTFVTNAGYLWKQGVGAYHYDSASTPPWVTGSINTSFSWVKSFGGSGDDKGRVIAIDSSDNVYVSGYFMGTAHFDNMTIVSQGSSDIFLALYSSSGTLRWVKRYGSTGSEMVTSIAIDQSGNVFLGGYYSGTGNFGGSDTVSAGTNDIFIAKYSSTGEHIWSQHIGGTQNDLLNGLTADSQGNVIAVGQFSGSINVGTSTWVSVNNGPDQFLIKYSPQGSLVWARTFANASEDQAIGVAVNKNDEIFVTGYFLGWVNFGGGVLARVDGNDYFLAKFTSLGNNIWAKRFGGTGGQRVVAIDIDPFGDVYLAGDYMYSLDAGGGVVTGWDMDTFVAKYSGLDGSYKWLQVINGDLIQEPTDLAVDDQGNVFLTGYYSSTAKFGLQTLNSVGGSYDIFVSKYSTLGALLWVKSFGGPLYDSGFSIAAHNNYAAITGYFSGTSSFANYSLTSSGSNDGFVLKLVE